LKIGFNGKNLIFNGNGKTLTEIGWAIKNNCYLNIDSLFNLKHTIEVCQQLKKEFSQYLPAKLIIRVNQSIDTSVHNYLSTSVKQCKFGIEINQLENIIKIIQKNKDIVNLTGFHTHLGSTIDSVSYYNKAVDNLTSLIENLKDKYNIETLELINFGGGLGINYKMHFNRTFLPNLNDSSNNAEYPKPYDLASTISKYAHKLKGLKVIVEPGKFMIYNLVLNPSFAK
jgi:diaminopimelate decarboxylase